MALILADRVKESTTTTGTSDFALGGAITGFQTFSASVGANNTTYYSVADGADWEVGLGTLSNDGLTLARTTVLQSSNADAKVSFAAGTKEVFVTYPADKAVSDITSTDASIVVSRNGSIIDLAVSEASPASTLLAAVRNTTGATLTKGTAVYISGATGQKSTVSKALATGDSTSAQTLGLITSDLANNSNGYVTVIGLVSNINTSAYTDGAQLYLSPTTAGTLTATKPYAPDHLVYVAIVEYAHATQGKLFVRVQNGYELDELHNVSAQSPTTGQTLVYNASTSLWEKNTVSLTAGVNGTLPVANGGTGITSFGSGVATFLGTPSSANLATAVTDETGTGALVFANTPTLVTPILGTPTSATLTNATGLPLTTGVTGTLPTANGGTNLTSFTSGGVVYASSTSALATGSALQFTGTNLGLGTTNPDVFSRGDARILGIASTGNASVAVNAASGSTSFLQLGSNGVRDFQISATSSSVTLGTGASGNNPLLFAIGFNEYMRLTTTGLGIGTSSPAYKLHVVGVVASIQTRASALISYYGAPTTGSTGVVNDTNSLVLSVANTAGGNTAGVSIAALLEASASNKTAMVFSADDSGGVLVARMRLDSAGNLGLGVTPSAWGSDNSRKAFDISTYGGLTSGSLAMDLVANAYFNGTNWVAKTTGAGTKYVQTGGVHYWQIAGSVSAGSQPTYTSAMTLDASGNLLVGGTTAVNRLSVLETSSSSAVVFVGNNLNASNSEYGRIRFGSTASSSAYVDYGGQIASFSEGGINQSNLRFYTSNAAAAAERARIDSSGNFGLGETSPSTFGKLVVKGGTISLVTDTSAQRRLSFWSQGNGNSENAYIQVQNDGATTNTGEILFATKNTATTLAERARITAEGNLLVGTTSTSVYTGNSLAYEPAGSYLVQNHATAKASGAAYTYFQHNGSEIGSVTQVDTTSIALNNVSRIKFPATQSASSDANTLDDYEEGTFTPTIVRENTALGTVTYTTQDGKYTKIGRVVYITCRVAWSNIASAGSGPNRIDGLPFSSGETQANGGATFYSSGGVATNPVLAGLFYNSTIYLRKSANILAETNLDEAFNNSGSFAFNGYYFV